MRSAFILVTALVAASTATPWGTRANKQCAAYCRETNKFSYDVGTIYSYEYSAETASQIRGTSDEESRLHISALAEFEVASQCEFILRLKKVSLEESDPRDATRRAVASGSAKFGAALERNPLIFAFQDGHVEHMCPASGEESWVLNLKRGILSSMQNSMQNLTTAQTVYETDIAGHCESNYTVLNQANKGVTISRTKNLLACTGRNSHSSPIQATPYSSTSSIQSIPLLRSDNECQQTIRNKRLEKAVCTETHVFQPFSNGNSGAVTKVSQTLTYQSERRSKEVTGDFKGKKVTLLFDGQHQKTSLVGSDSLAVEVLKQLTKESETEFSARIPSLFSRLVTVLRPLSYAQLSSIFRNTHDARAKKYLMDAAPLVGTAASMALVRDLIQDGLLAEVEINMWLASLAFQQKPTLEMITAVTPILAESNPRHKALLSISAMINAYCRHQPGCASKLEIVKAVGHIEKQIGAACRSSDSQTEQTILMALKSLGNAGLIFGSDGAIRKCYEEDNSMVIRLAAIDAIRRVPCDSFDRSHLLSYFRNINHDSELRIASYLAIMRCPTPQLLEEVKQTLISESVNQVGSFVWTHLTNLQETSSPSKQQIRQMLSSEFLRNKFNTDVRKFSRNVEASAFWDELNVGGTIEGNVIFSSKSYLPRSGMLNLTVDLFGESVNLLELGARVEGFESLVESFFGPNGVYPEENIEKVLRSMRNKRSVDENSLNALSSIYDAKAQFADQPRGDIYMRVFGNELHADRFQGLGSFTKMDSPLSMLLRAVKDKDIDYTKSIVFLDASYIIPTIIGLPLNLTVNGTSTVNLRMGGKFNVGGLNDVEIRGHIFPSAAMEINGAMTVDAFVGRCGVQIQNTMHTASGIDGQVVIKGSQIVSVQLNTPKQKMDIFSMDSKIFFIHKDQVKPVEPSKPVISRRGCTPASLSRVFGAELCAEIDFYPKSATGPGGLLRGPSHAALYLQKTDSHDQYVFEYKWTNEEVKRQMIRTVSLKLDTPHSKIDRQISAKLTMDEPAKSLRAIFVSPLKNAELVGKYEFSEMLKGADVLLNVDGSEVASIRAALRSEITGNTGRYVPSLVVTRRSQELFNFQGSYNYVTGSKYSCDFQLKQLTVRPIRVTGDISKDGDKYDVSFGLKSYALDTSVSVAVRTSDKLLTTKTKIEYSLFETTSQNFEISTKYNRIVKGALQRITVSGVAQGSVFPVGYNTDFAWDFQTSPNYVENNLHVGIGDHQWDLKQLYSNQVVRDQHDFTMRIGLTCPQKNVDLLAFYVQQDTPTSFSASTGLRVAPGREWNGQLELQQKTEPARTYAGRLELSAPSGTRKLRVEVTETQSQQWDLAVEYKANKETQATLLASYKNLSSNIKMEHAVTVSANGVHFEDFKFETALTASADHTSLNINSQYGQRKVATSVEYKRPKEQQHTLEINTLKNDVTIFKTSLQIDLTNRKYLSLDVMAGRRVTAEFSVVPDGKTLSTNIELFWDKDRDQSQCFTFVGQLSGVNGDAVLKYPGRTITMAIILKGKSMAAEIEWASGQKIQLEMELQLTPETKRLVGKLNTPFASYDHISFDASHKTKDGRLDTNVAMEWDVHRFSLAATGSKTSENVKGSISFKSTFANLEEMGAEFDSVSSKPVHKYSLMVRHNGRQAKAFVSANLVKGRLSQAVLQVSTPITGFESVKMVVSHDQDGTSFESSAKLQGPFDYEALLKLSARKSLTETTGTVAITTSFTGLKAASTSLQLVNDGESRKLFLASELNGRRSVIDVNGMFRKTGMEANLRLDNVFHDQVSASLQHQYGSHLKTIGQMSWAADKKVAVNVQGEVKSANSVAVTGQLSAPNMETKIRLEHKLASGKLATSLETTLNDKTAVFAIDADSQKTPTSRTFRVNSALSIPFADLEDVKLILDYNNSPKKIITRFQLVDKAQTYTMEHTMNHDDAANWINVISIETPLNGLSSVVLNSKQSFLKGNLQHETDIKVNDKRISINVNYNKRDAQTNASGSLTSSWTEDFTFQFQNQDNKEEFHPILVIRAGTGQPIRLEAIHKRGPINPSLTLDIASHLAQPIKLVMALNNAGQLKSAKASLLWDSDKTINYLLEWTRSSQSALVKTELTTPFPTYSAVSAEANYDLASSRKTGFAAVTYNGQKIQVDGFATAEPVYQAEIVVSTPFKSYETIKATTIVDMINARTVAKFQRGGYEINLQGSMAFSADQTTVTATFNSPISGFEYINVEGSLDSNRRAVINVDFNGKKVALEGSYSNVKGKGSLSAALSTPFDGFSSTSVHLSFDLPSEVKSLTLKLSKDQETIQVQLQGSLTPKSGAFTATLSAPCCGISNFDLSGSYGSSVDRKSGQLKLELNGQKSEIEGKLNVGKKSGEIELKTSSSLRGLETVLLHAKYDAVKAQKTAFVTFSRNGEKIQAVGRANFVTLQRVEGSLDITTPFDSLNVIRLSANYDAMSAEKTAELIFSRNDQTIRLTAGGAMAGLQGKIESRIETPFAGYENVAAEFLFNLQLPKKVLSFIYEKDQVREMISAEMEMKENKIFVRATTPFNGFEKLSATSEYFMDGQQTRFVLLTEKNGKKMEIRFTGNLDMNNNEASFDLRTPFVGYEVISGLSKWNAEPKDAAFNLRLTKNDFAVEIQFGGKFSRKSSELSVNARTSINGWENLALSAAYDVESNVSGSLNVEKNGEKTQFTGEAVLTGESAKFAVTTPFEGLKSVGMSGSLKSTDSSSKLATLSIEKEGTYKDMSVFIKFDNKSAIISVETPFAGYEKLSAKLNYDVNSPQKTIGFSARKNSHRLELDGTLSVKPQEAEAEFKLTSTLSGLENVILSAQYTNNKVKTVTTRAAFNGKIIESVAGFNCDNSSMQLDVQLTTPFNGYEKLSVNAHVHFVNRFTRLSYDLNGKRYEFNGYFASDAPGFTATLNTPLAGYEVISFEARINGQMLELSAITPFIGFNKVALSADYDLTSAEKYGRLIMSADQTRYESQIVGTFVGLSSDLSMNIQLPVRGMENIVSMFRYNLDGPEKVMLFSLDKSQQHYEFDAKLTTTPVSSEFSAHIRTPLAGFEDVDAGAGYSLKDKSATLLLERNGRAVVRLIGVANFEPTASNFGVSVAFPALFSKDIDMAASHQMSADRSGIEAKVKVGTSEARFSGKHSQWVSGSATINSNFDSMKEIKITWNNDPSAEKSVTVSATVNDQVVKASVEGRVQSHSEALIRFTFSSPFTGSQSLEAQWDANTKGKITGQVNYQGKMRFGLELVTKYGNGVSNIDLSVKTSIPNWEQVTIKGSMMCNKEKSLEAVVQWAKTKKIHAKINGEFTPMKSNGKFSLSTPYTLPISVDGEYDLMSSSKSVILVLSRGDEQLINMNGRINVQSPSSIKSVIKFTTPLNQMTIKTDYDMQKQPNEISVFVERNGLQSELRIRYQYDANRSSLVSSLSSQLLGIEKWNFEFGLDTTEGVNANSAISWASDKSIRAAVKLSSSELSASFVTPFVGYEKTELISTFDFEGVEQMMDATVSWSDKNIAVKSKWDTSASGLGFNVHINSPFEGFQDIRLHGGYTSSDDYSVKLTFNRGDQKVELNGKLVSELNGSKTRIQFSASRSTSADVSAVVEYDLSQTLKTASISMVQGSSRFSISAAGQYEDKITGSLTIEASGMETVKMNLELDVNKVDKTGRVALERGGRQIEMIATGSFSESGSKLRVAIQTPFEGYKKILFSTKFNQKAFDISVDYARNQKVHLSGSYLFDSSLYSLNTTLETPFEALESVSLNSYVDLTAGFYGSSSVQWAADRAVGISAAYAPSNFQFGIRTPYETLRHGKLSGYYNMKEAEKTLETNVEYNEYQGSLGGRYLVDQSSRGLSAKASWNWQTVAVESLFEDKENGQKLYGKLTTPFEGFNSFTASMECNHVSGQDDYNVIIETPFKTWNKAKMTMKTVRQGENVEVSTSGTIADYSATAKAAFVKNANINIVSLDAEVPFIEAIRTFSSKIQYSCDVMKDINITGSIVIPSGEYEAKGSMMLDTTSINVNAGVKTPTFAKSIDMGASYNANAELSLIEGNMFIWNNKVEGRFEKLGNQMKIDASVHLPSLKIVGLRLNTEVNYHSARQLEASATFTSVSGAHTVVLSYELSNAKFSGRFDLETPLIQSNITASTKINYGHLATSGITFETKVVVGEHVRELTGSLKAGQTIEAQAKYACSRGYNGNVMLVAGPTQGKVTIETPKSTHRFSYNVNTGDEYDFVVKAESPLIQDTVVEGKWALIDRRIQTSLSARYGKDVHSINCVYNNNNAGELSATLSAASPLLPGQVASIEGKCLHGNMINTRIQVQLFGQTHLFTASGHILPEFDAQIRVESPTLPWSTVAAIVKTDYLTGNQKEAEFSVIYGEKTMTLAGKMRYAHWRDFDGFVTLNTPFEALPKVRLDAHLYAINAIDAGVMFQTHNAPPFKIAFNTKYQKTVTSMNIMANLTSTITQLEKVGVLMAIPLNLKNADLQAMLTLPNIHYSLNGRLMMSDTKFEAFSEIDFDHNKYAATVLLNTEDIYQARIDVTTPIRGYERYSWDVKGQANVKRWGEATAFLDWNGQRIEFNSNVKAEPRAYIALFQLNTPFADFERYALRLRLEGTERKTLQMELEYPGTRIGADFDYVFNSNTDFICKVSISTPFKNYESFTIQATNQLTDSSYVANLEARFATYGFSVNLDGAFRNSGLDATLEGRYNEQVVSMKLNGVLSDKSIDGKFIMTTPFESFKSLDSFIYLSKDRSAENRGLGFSLNGRKVIVVTLLTHPDGTRTLEVQNPWRPITMSFSMERSSDLTNYHAQICWDVNSRTESTLGGQLIIKNTSYGKQVTFKTLIPQRVFVVDYFMELTSAKLDHSFSVTWAEDKSAGYKILLDNVSTLHRTQQDAVIRLDLPVRSFEIESHRVFSANERSTFADFKWDAARDRSKRVGARFEVGPGTAWKKDGRQARLSFLHSALEQDIVLAGEYMKNEQSINAKVDLTYSPSEEHRLTMETSTALQGAEISGLIFSIRHPVSQINLQFNSSLTKTAEMVKLAARVDYQDRLNNARFVQLSTRSMVNRRQVDVELQTADHSLVLSNAMQHSSNAYTVNTHAAFDDIDILTLRGHMDISMPIIQIDASSANGIMMNLYAGMPSKREITLRATRDMNGKTITDGHLSVKLNRTDLLDSRVYWRAASLAELRTSVTGTVINAIALSESALSRLATFVATEATEKRATVKPIAGQIYQRLVDYSKVEMASFCDDFQDTIAYFKAMYASNEFYLQQITATAQQMMAIAQPYFEIMARNLVSITDALIGEGSAFYNAMQTTYTTLSQAATNFYQQLSVFVADTVVEASRRYSNAASVIGRRYRQLEIELGAMMQRLQALYDTFCGRMEEIVMQKVEEFRKQVIELAQNYAVNFRPYIERMNTMIATLRTMFNDARQNIKESIESMKTQLMTYAPIKKIVVFYSKYASWFEEFHFYDYIEKMTSAVEKMYRDVEDRVKTIAASYKPLIDPIVQAIDGQMNALQQLPIVIYAKQVVNNIYAQAGELYKFLEVETEMRNFLRQILQRVDRITKQLAVDLKGSFDFPWRPVFVYEPASGRLEYSQRLPFKWENFNTAPEFYQLPLLKKVATAKQNFLRELDLTNQFYDLVDTMIQLKPALNLRRVVPPFGSHALIGGTQHYMTFDKKFYEFAGECSYLLVSDFFNHNFSVVVNYEGSSGKITRKSLTIVSDGKQIDVDSNFRVAVSGRKIEMPMVYNKTSIVRDGQRIIINNNNGYRVECNLYRDICTVHITGWSFGKTGGLFGTYNNEPADDFLTPYRQLRTDEEVDSFANSWKVGTSRCRVRNFAITSPAPSSRNVRLCDEIFSDSDSVLRPCFRAIDPTPYKRMCLNDLATYENSPKKDVGVCTAASAYISECRLAGFDLFAPSQCVRCELENGLVLGSGDVKTFKNDAPRSADVVFVVDQKTCLKNIRLSSLPVAIEASLKDKGLNNNRFAVVGFGGEGIYHEAHIQTAEGQIWSSRKGAQAALEDMPFDGEAKADIFAALRYAVNLPYRAGVSKQIILASCVSDCEAKGYADALTLLIENDIKLHLLQPRDLVVKGAKGTSEELKNVFGFGAEEVYTIRNIRNLRGDRELRRQLVIPKDFCTPLALETNGTLFDLKKMSNDNAIQAKKFVDVFARRFSATAEPSDCQRCDCIGDRDGVGNILCQRCVSPILERFIKDWEQLVYENEIANQSSSEEITVTEVKPVPPVVAKLLDKQSKIQKPRQ